VILAGFWAKTGAILLGPFSRRQSAYSLIAQHYGLGSNRGKPRLDNAVAKAAANKIRSGPPGHVLPLRGVDDAAAMTSSRRWFGRHQNSVAVCVVLMVLMMGMVLMDGKVASGEST
jgi:hypothetical protein